MLLLGLTGSIGMGKTETAKLFAKQGIPVFDADRTVHDLYAKRGAAVEPLRRVFPEAIVDDAVDRTLLAQQVLEDTANLDRLNEIVHPMVRDRQKAFVAKAALDGADMVLLDIPLLFETRRLDEFDRIIVVSTDPETQRTRVLARPGMSERKFQQILARQTPDREKRAKADFVIETSGGLADAERQVVDIIKILRADRKDPKE